MERCTCSDFIALSCAVMSLSSLLNRGLVCAHLPCSTQLTGIIVVVFF